MKLALALCAALLFIIFVQADESEEDYGDSEDGIAEAEELAKEFQCEPGTTFTLDCNECHCSEEGYPEDCSAFACQERQQWARIHAVLKRAAPPSTLPPHKHP